MKRKLFFYFLFLLCLKCDLSICYINKHTFLETEDNFFERHERSIKRAELISYGSVMMGTEFYVEFDKKYVLDNLFGYISLQTCLKFNKKTSKIRGKGINFLISSKNKISFPKHHNEPTNIYLKQSNFDNIRSLTYHVGLALGLIPEIQRADRDNYVNIIWQNTTSKSKPYFKNLKRSPPSTHFDYGSIMLVSPMYGGVNGQITYRTNLYPYYDSLVYKRSGFSHYNFKTLSNKYCRNRCPQLVCQNGGFPSPNCKKCICNYFFTGNLCENILTYQSKRCGSSQYYNASSTIQYLNSSSIQGPCYYWISSQNSRNVKITVEKVNFNELVTCTSDKGLFIYYRSDMGVTPLCIFNNITKFTLPAVSNKIYIIFYGSGLYNSFNISYQSI
uniref:Metalloendopeptidase n=1 Tax=Strongyloides venezuelensis TaxID=75913 RepID=A0A0K0F3J2_STRVS